MPGHEKGTRATVRNVLSMKEQFALRDLIITEYVKSELDNNAFAKLINETTEKGTFRAPITASHIATMIVALDIPANKAKRRTPIDSVGDCLALTARVQALEEQLEKLAAYVKARVK